MCIAGVSEAWIPLPIRPIRNSCCIRSILSVIHRCARGVFGEILLWGSGAGSRTEAVDNGCAGGLPSVLTNQLIHVNDRGPREVETMTDTAPFRPLTDRTQPSNDTPSYGSTHLRHP